MRSRIQNPESRTQDPLRVCVWGGGAWILDLGFWILSQTTQNRQVFLKSRIQDPERVSTLAGRKVQVFFRKRSLDECLMRLLKIQSRPGLGPVALQDHRSRHCGSKGPSRCWRGQDHEARSKAPFTTIQGRKPFPDNPVGPL